MVPTAKPTLDNEHAARGDLGKRESKPQQIGFRKIEVGAFQIILPLSVGGLQTLQQ